MKYFVTAIAMWLVAGLLAYVAGRNSNIGVQVFCGFSSGGFTIFACVFTGIGLDVNEKKNNE